MHIGISTFPTDYAMDIALLAKMAEELGFESLWVPEHPILPVNTRTPFPGSADGIIPKANADICDPFVALGRASAVTTTLKLGTGICLVPERNPLHLAKEVATLDIYSGGRFLFGIGAGWLQEETEIMGGNFQRRWTQAREAVLAMKELWTKTRSEFHGKYYDFPPVYSFPKPAQQPHPPILLGSTAPNVFKRIVAWGDGWMPYLVTPAEVRQGRAKLDALARAAGRDPASIQVTAFHHRADPDLIKQLEDAGATRVVIPASPWLAPADEKQALAELEQMAEALFG